MKNRFIKEYGFFILSIFLVLTLYTIIYPIIKLNFFFGLILIPFWIILVYYIILFFNIVLPEKLNHAKRGKKE